MTPSRPSVHTPALLYLKSWLHHRHKEILESVYPSMASYKYISSVHGPRFANPTHSLDLHERHLEFEHRHCLYWSASSQRGRRWTHDHQEGTSYLASTCLHTCSSCLADTNVGHTLGWFIFVDNQWLHTCTTCTHTYTKPHWFGHPQTGPGARAGVDS